MSRELSEVLALLNYTDMDEGEARQLVLDTAAEAGVVLESVRWVPELWGWSVVVIDGTQAYVLEGILADIEPAVLRLAVGHVAITAQEWHMHSRASSNPRQMALVGGILVAGTAIMLTKGPIQALLLGVGGVGALIGYFVWIARRQDPLFLKALRQYGDRSTGRALIEVYQRRARAQRKVESPGAGRTCTT